MNPLKRAFRLRIILGVAFLTIGLAEGNWRLIIYLFGHNGAPIVTFIHGLVFGVGVIAGFFFLIIAWGLEVKLKKQQAAPKQAE